MCEPYCLYVRVLRDSDAIVKQDRKVPEHCWNPSISKDICEAQTGVLPGTFSIDLLSDTEFLVYKLPKTGQGMTRDDATQAQLQELDLATQKRCQKMENSGSQGKGMIPWVDKYHAQQRGLEKEQALGQVPSLPVFPPWPNSPDDYHSAREPSEFKYDSEETDEPKEDREGDEEDDGDDTSVCSDVTSQCSGHDTDWTWWTNTSNHNQKCNQRKCKEHRGCCPTYARKEENKRTGKVVLSLFWDSPKEGTLTYTDWCWEVEEYLQKGYDDNRVKDAMLSLVEGQAYINFRSCDEGRNRTPAQILKEMDSIYNVSVMFWDLNAWMCGLKQGMNEPIKAYYERMADISVKLEQYQGNRFGLGELSLIKNDCFYVGLKEHNKYRVSHMKDRDQYRPTQMLKEIWEQEDSRYPANSTPKLINMDNQSKSMTHYDRKSTSYDKDQTYAMRQANVQLLDPVSEEPEPQQASRFDATEMYDEGYYVAIVNMVNKAEKWGRCFNRCEEGHWWQECTKPLKESLWWAKEWIEHKNQLLNRDGELGQRESSPPR